MKYTLNVNHNLYTVDVPAQSTLLHVLREELGLMGAREACGIGMCGACTVLVDGQIHSSCLLLVAQAAGKQIITVEGLAQDGQLHPVQQAFVEHQAFQCSFCTPGFILAVIAMLRENPHPTDDEIRDYLSGNLCRCGSYPEILAAVHWLVDNNQAKF